MQMVLVNFCLCYCTADDQIKYVCVYVCVSVILMCLCVYTYKFVNVCVCMCQWSLRVRITCHDKTSRKAITYRTTVMAKIGLAVGLGFWVLMYVVVVGDPGTYDSEAGGLTWGIWLLIWLLYPVLVVFWCATCVCGIDSNPEFTGEIGQESMYCCYGSDRSGRKRSVL
jgi:hypothetical protein